MFDAFVYSLITGIVIALVSAWATVQLSLKRFRDEKWWQKKYDAYENTIESLHQLKKDCDADLAAYYKGKFPSAEQ